jgi:DNA (cytosine-5)-methyltransferase 1
MPPPRLTSIELFTGAGGLALGIADAGFHHRLLLEYNHDACETLRKNLGLFGDERCRIEECDVKSFDFTPYEGVDLLAAGAHCQPFSIGGRHRAHKDERNLFPQVFRAVRETRPRAVVIENVKGLLRKNLADFVAFIELQLRYPFVVPRDPLDPEGWKSHLRTLLRVHGSDEAAYEMHYDVKTVLLDAASFGVPQRRQRVFFVAIRRDVDATWVPPRPTHSGAALRLAQVVNCAYWEKFGVDRRRFPTHPHAGKWLRESGTTDPWVTVRDALVGLPTPIAGAESWGWPNHVGQPGARAYSGHTGSPLDAPGKTLKAGVHGVPGGENMLRRPNGTVRYFTVREAARLQTFPDYYVFSGAWTEAMRQIGNAVPVRLAAAVALSIRVCLARPSQNAQPQQRPPRPRESVQVEIPELLIRSA